MPPRANPAALAAGKWEGSWQSDATDYSGHMQAIIMPTTTALKNKEMVQQYSAEFRFRIYELGFDEYTVTLTGSKLPDGRIRLEGKKDLGQFKGGIIWFDGFVYPDKDELYCDYISEKDSGTYRMRRQVLENQ
jgi:hypothetical protein